MSKFTDELQKIKSLSDNLAEYEDTQLVLDTIEGETDAMELLDWSVDKQESEKALQARLKDNIAYIKKRIKASQTREQGFKEVAESIYNAIGEPKVTRPTYTAYKQKGRMSVKVTDETLIPDEYMKIKKTADKTALASALEGKTNIQGAELVQGDDIFMIRSR